MTKVVQEDDPNKTTAVYSLHRSEVQFIQHRLMFSQRCRIMHACKLSCSWGSLRYRLLIGLSAWCDLPLGLACCGR